MDRKQLTKLLDLFICFTVNHHVGSHISILYIRFVRRGFPELHCQRTHWQMTLLDSQTKLLILDDNDLMKILWFREALPELFISNYETFLWSLLKVTLKRLNNRDYLQRAARNTLVLNTDLSTCLCPIPDGHNENFWKFYKRLASGNISNMFLSYLPAWLTSRPPAKAMSYILLPGYGMQFHGSYWLSTPATHLRLWQSLRAKAITLYFCLRLGTDTKTHYLCLQWAVNTWSFPRTWVYSLHTEYCIRKQKQKKKNHQKQQWTLLQNSWHCAPFLFFNSLISSHSPYCSLHSEK